MPQLKLFKHIPPKEQEVILALKKISEGILLAAVDKNGIRIDYGSIAILTNEGKLCLPSKIDKNIGLELTPSGSIKIEFNLKIGLIKNDK